MFGPLDKFWRSLKRRPLALLLSGALVGVPIGWFFGSRSTVEKISIPPAKATTSTTFPSEEPTAKATTTTAPSRDELKTESAKLVTAIRGLARSYYDEENRLRTAADEKSAKTDLQSDRDNIRRKWLDDSANLHKDFMDRYQANFWAHAIQLRQAIVAKVGNKVPGAQNPILFQQPTNILGIEQVANSLDLLGRALPANAQTKP
jgi:hypothetical protein